jgi:mono/diheme cytochrome c family protein
LASRGRSVYNANCVACHNPNPAESGAIAPAIQGSSETLLEAKVLHNTYPPGYTPKRDTNAMIALPHLAKQIPALAAYLK